MVELHGIPVSPGVAIGPALVLDREGYRIERCQVDPTEVTEEITRLRCAVDGVSRKTGVEPAGDFRCRWFVDW